LLFPLYHRKVVFLADTVDSGKRLGALLASQRLGAILVSRQPEPVVSLPPLRLQRSDIRGRMVLQQWTR
jgi:hypothetical protein